MDRDTLVRKFAQSVGVEKADALVAEAEAELGFTDRSSYDRQDVQDLCELVQYGNEGYVAQVANEIRVHEQAQQRFAALLGNVPDPAVVVTFDESSPVVSSVNDAFVETFGYARSDAEGTTLSDLVLPPDLDATEAERHWLTTDGTGREVRRVTADGEERTFLFRSVLTTREAGEVEGHGIYTDITERKRREQKLHSQNERLEQFLDMVSHDLRNPLAVAHGRTGVLLEEVDDESIHDQLASIQRSHERMRSLIDDLMELARQGPLAEETQPVDLAAVSRSAWEQVETGGATLAVDASDYRIQSVPRRLAELLENLFRNAVEHGSAGDTETTTGAAVPTDELVVRVGTLSDESRSGFFVADDGAGIDEPDAVFERGYSTADDGTGLGLSIVETIAGAHGWEVDVTESRSGGARFEFVW